MILPPSQARATRIACQTTLGSKLLRTGVGMHTGAMACVTLAPAPAGAGIQFVCGTGGRPTRVPARAAFVVGTERCTALGDGEARVETVEHLLSALAGMQIDNAYVEVEGPELPILDGSAAPWVEAIEEAGVVATDALRRVGRLEQCVVLREGESWMLARPADGFTITCAAHFDHPLLGTRAFTFAGAGEEYAREIAPARTFGFIEEVEALRAAGRALGGTLDNALVIYRDHFSGPLRLPDEWLRHKALDLVGDLALVGAALQADITAIRPGHRTNVAFASLLAQSMTMDDGAANTQA